MDELTNKQFNNYNYTSRYTNVPFYYNTKDDRYINGLGANMLKDNSWVAHKVTDTDTLDKLALSYYNNPTYWWIIAYFNDIQDAFIDLKTYFEVIKIPNISGIAFGDLR